MFENRSVRILIRVTKCRYDRYIGLIDNKKTTDIGPHSYKTKRIAHVKRKSCSTKQCTI